MARREWWMEEGDEPGAVTPEGWVEARVAAGGGREESERLAALLAAMGLEPERWDRYEADVAMMVEVALDAYFDGLRNDKAL